jgi:1-acyl-sn-glycerol-3-phosphate acyltransferase
VEANDGDDWTLIFPEGTNFDGESIVLPDKASISEGKRIVLDGARVPANESLSMCLNYARLLSVEKVTVVQS